MSGSRIEIGGEVTRSSQVFKQPLFLVSTSLPK